MIDRLTSVIFRFTYVLITQWVCKGFENRLGNHGADIGDDEISLGLWISFKKLFS